MKTLHTVIHGEIAGGQIVCLRIIEALHKGGHQALVVSPSRGPFTELLRRKRVPVFFIPFKRTYSFHRAFQLARLIKKEGIDLVYTHGMVPANIHSRLAARLAGVPCISHIHIANVFNQNPLVRRYQIFLDNWTSRFCHRLIAVSQSTKDSLIQQGISGDRIEVIPNGIDCHKIHCRETREEILRKFHLDPKERLVGTIGRLCPTKGQEEFLRVAKGVSQEMPDVVWMVIGKDMEFGGRYETQLRTLAQEGGLNGRVIFTGHQPDPFSLLNALEFFVLPSKLEGMPLVILEAMALKKAVIASAVGGVPEVIVDGKTGILVPAGDSRSLAEAILKLLRNPELAKAMGEAGFERARENFSESEMSRRTLTLCQEALSY